MNAINVLTAIVYPVHRYKNVMYYETESPSLPYYVFEPCSYGEEDIKVGYEYTHYKIDRELYSGYLTNNYKTFATQQIDIWEVIK